MKGEINANAALFIGAGEVEKQVIICFVELQRDRQRPIAVDGVCLTPTAIPYFCNSFPENGFRVRNHLLRYSAHEFAPITRIHLLHSGFCHVVRCDLTLEIEPDRKSTRLNSSHVSESRLP